MEATEGTVTEKKTLLAQARTIRAASFLYLLTAFANAYDPAKNPDDLGLPLVTSTNVTDLIPPRSTLKVCFDYMINDLVLAIDNLPAQHKDRWRVTKHGAAGVLARVYLYMHDYEKANQYATLALQSSQTNKILDYNTFAGISSFPAAGLNSEKLWLDYISIASSAAYSQQLLNLYTPEDRRLKLFSGKNSSGMVQKTGNLINGGISYPEMYLTQAEYLARNDQPDEAMEIVNLLRKNRLPPTAPDLNLSAATGEEALTRVLEERRRELAFSGVRWLDMKRLDQENKMPEVFRYQNNDPDGTAISSLPPRTKGYTFEIPLKVQLLNPNIQLNNE